MRGTATVAAYSSQPLHLHTSDHQRSQSSGDSCLALSVSIILLCTFIKWMHRPLSSAGSAVAGFDAVAGDHKMRAVGTMSEHPPMLGILAAPRVAREALQRKTTRKRNPEAAVGISLNLADHRQRRALLFEPRALRNVEDRVSLVPIELFGRDGLIGGIVQVIAREEDGTAIHESPAALDVEPEVADLYHLAFAIAFLTPGAELEYLHVGGAPAVADRLPNQHSKLGRDAIGE